MTDTNSNMEKSTRTVKEILADIETNTGEQVVLQRAIKALYKELDKAHKVEMKDASKRKKKDSSSTEKRDPSGFNAKQPVPPEFCEQPWGCEPDQELPRTMLTKMVYDYVKEENLQDPSDKRRIFPNEVLRKLFHLKETDELHFNNFQTYMKRLYDRSFDDVEDDVSVSSSGSISESDVSDVDSKKKTKGKKETKAVEKVVKKTKGKKSSTVSSI